MQSRPTPTWNQPMVADLIMTGQIVAGVDEVGRGAWAGPVVAGAVILPVGLELAGLNDSKLLTPPTRRRLDREIRHRALAVGLGWVSAVEVDERGLSWAVQQSGLRALANLSTVFDVVILDGKHNYLANHHPAITLVKADQLVTPVAAASVVAKVARDRYMECLAIRYPGYALERHKGYGTKAHALAIAGHGPLEIHRRSWGPLREALSVND